MMKIFQALLILALVLMFFSMAPIVLWILKLFLAIGFIAIAVDAYKENKTGKAIIFAILAILFQPVLNIGLGKAIWYTLQIALIIWLLTLIFQKQEY